MVGCVLGQLKPPERYILRGPPLDSLGGGGGRSICCGQIIYFNRARRRAENFTFCYMLIWNSS